MGQSLLGRFKAPLRMGVCHWWAGCGFLICTGRYTILQELLDTLRVSRFANPWVFGRGRLRSLSINELVEQLSAHALATRDTENHFRAMAATGDVQKADAFEPISDAELQEFDRFLL